MNPKNGEKKASRHGMVVEVRPEKLEEYKRLHADTWPGVLKTIEECNIRNYSIYFKEIEPGKNLLFSYFEYIGDDFEADMKKMAAEQVIQEWWEHCVPCLKPVPNSGEDELWSGMEEVFHTD